MEPVLVVGAGGHARAVLEAIRAAGVYRVVGLIDSFQPVGTVRFGYRVVGGEADIPRLLDESALEGVVLAVGDNFQRAAFWARIQAAAPEARLRGVIHPAAVVAPDVALGAGAVILPGAVVVSGSRIGQGSLINTSASLDHDGEMGAWASLAPGVVAGGCVCIGARAWIGLGARIIQQVKVGADTVVGAGSLVLQDLPEEAVAFGSPARVVRQRKPDEALL